MADEKKPTVPPQEPPKRPSPDYEKKQANFPGKGTLR